MPHGYCRTRDTVWPACTFSLLATTAYGSSDSYEMADRPLSMVGMLIHGQRSSVFLPIRRDMPSYINFLRLKERQAIVRKFFSELIVDREHR